MSEKARTKEECKNGKPSKTVGATKEEAAVTAVVCRQIANNPETSQDLRARVAALATAIASTAGDAARREALLLQAALLLAQGES